MRTNSHRNGRRGVGFIEVLIAAVFVATGGLAIYTSSLQVQRESVWGAEKIFIEGLLSDMVEFCRSQDYNSLSVFPLPSQPMQPTQVDLLQNHPAVNRESFYSDDDPSTPPTAPELDGDVFVKEYDERFEALEVNRSVHFEEKPAGSGRGIVTCRIVYKSQTGPTITRERRLAVYDPNS